MIGRVLAFVACVALVTAETCNGADGAATLDGSGGLFGKCCSGANWNNQLDKLYEESLPVATLNEGESGFHTTAGVFKIGVNIHMAYYQTGSSALATHGTYTGLPKIIIADMGSKSPTKATPEASPDAAPGTANIGAGEDCRGVLIRHFKFSQIAGTSGSPSYVDDTKTASTYVYAAVNVIAAATIYTEIHHTAVERLSIETIPFYFKFTKQIQVSTTSAVTYASVQINVVLTQSSVTPVTLASFLNLVTDANVACTDAKADVDGTFCGVNPRVKLEVGIVTITNLPFMTVLRLHGDNIATAAHRIPVPMGIQIDAKDVKSGLVFDNVSFSGSETSRAHTLGAVPTTCNGLVSGGGSCTLSYTARLRYQRSKTAAGNDGTENTGNTSCKITGAQLHVGNDGGGSMTAFQEIQCRNQQAPTVYGQGVATTGDPDPCPFAADGQDADDNFKLKVTISTSDWCPKLIADNSVIGWMKTTHDSYFDGNKLEIEVYVRAVGVGSQNLDINKVQWDTLQGSCDTTAGDDCNVGGDVDGSRSLSSIDIIGGTPLTLGQTYQVDGAAYDSVTYDGCSATAAAAFSNSHSSSLGYHCMIKAELYLCQWSPWVSATGCPTSGTSAFEIDDQHTSTKIVLTGSLKVGYPSVTIARKRTIEISPGSETIYALLQASQGTAEVEANAGISRVPVSADETVETTTSETEVTTTDTDVAVEEESNPMLIYIIVGVFLFISVFVGALVMYLRRSKAEKKAEHPVPITVEVNKNTAAMA